MTPSFAGHLYNTLNRAERSEEIFGDEAGRAGRSGAERGGAGRSGAEWCGAGRSSRQAGIELELRQVLLLVSLLLDKRLDYVCRYLQDNFENG